MSGHAFRVSRFSGGAWGFMGLGAWEKWDGGCGIENATGRLLSPAELAFFVPRGSARSSVEEERGGLFHGFGALLHNPIWDWGRGKSGDLDNVAAGEADGLALLQADVVDIHDFVHNPEEHSMAKTNVFLTIQIWTER